jgi:hypothetical protein
MLRIARLGLYAAALVLAWQVALQLTLPPQVQPLVLYVSAVPS